MLWMAEETKNCLQLNLTQKGRSILDEPKRAHKRERGRPLTWEYPERIDASPEEIAEMVLRMPPKKRGEWRFEKESEEGLP